MNCLLIPILAVGLLLSVWPGPLSSTAADWPQLQHDAQRTGSTPDGPEPPWTIVWHYDFAEEGEDVLNIVQAVVHQDTVFVGSRHGSMHAIDAETGHRKWRFAGCGPVLHTAAAADGRVFFGALDGLYALNTADGALAWKYPGQTVHGFGAAPLLAEGKLFIGERSGTFHALDPATGHALWSADLSAPICQTAAYADPAPGERSGRVFVGAEDMVFRCLDAATGKELWHAGPLNGVSFRDYHPVVTPRGRVVVRTWNPWPYRVVPPAEEGGEYAKWPPQTEAGIHQALAEGRYPRAEEADSAMLIESIREHPEQQGMYVFDVQTGKEPFVAVHNPAVSVDGPTCPMTLDPAGNWIMPLALVCLNAFVRVDPQTGHYTEYLVTEGKYGSIGDETYNLSVGGRFLFLSQAEEMEGSGEQWAFNLERPEWFGLQSLDRYMRLRRWNYEYNCQSSGNAISISGNRLFHLCNHALICRQGKESE